MYEVYDKSKPTIQAFDVNGVTQQCGGERFGKKCVVFLYETMKLRINVKI